MQAVAGNLAILQALSMPLATIRDRLRLPHQPQAAAARTPCRPCAARRTAAAGGPRPHRGSAGTCTRAHSREPPAGTCTARPASDQLSHSSCTWPAHSHLPTPLQGLWALTSATKVWVQGRHLSTLCKLLLHCTHMGPVDAFSCSCLTPGRWKGHVRHASCAHRD